MREKLISGKSEKHLARQVRKILIVDDYAPTTQILTDIFQEILPNIKVISANQHEEALTYFSEHQDIDLVIIENDFGHCAPKGTKIVEWMLNQRQDVVIVANSSSMSDNDQLMESGCHFHNNTDKNPEQLVKIARLNNIVFAEK